MLGGVIRARRHLLGKTLVEVATAGGLSHSFLSQLERGHARPSMRSLFLIAQALETTQQALLAAAAPDLSPTNGSGDPNIRLDRGGGSSIPVQTGSARLISHVEGGADVTEFLDLPTEFEDAFSHTRYELVYVVSGHIEIELTPPGSDTPEIHTLGPLESIGYPGATAHRHRRVGEARCVFLVVHSGPDVLESPPVPAPAPPHDH
ncbi:helix-turn-helix domain-containing protein [Sanguibacter antarcticus]|uniref:helix-turn-helix domain-containing protein n=1 Tax=Sanguibacter antarcticus TaxID=372484 RepID=UPI001B805732|nr:XRE family transcriptional regulator [Sanguibacter antarcticus]